MNVVKRVYFIALMIWMLFVINSYAASATINAEGARMRREPNTTSDVLTIVYSGETVDIIEKNGEWYKVKYGEHVGYIREDLMKVSGEVEQVPQEEEKEVEEEQTSQENPSNNVEENHTEAQENGFQEVEKQLVSDAAVRIVPSISASIIGDLKSGAKVTVIRVMNAWSCIRYKEKTAWIPSSFLSDVKEQPEPEKPETKTGYVNVTGAIIRKGPSTSAEIITEWAKNKPVEIIGEEGDWYKLNFNGEEAYVAKRLISDSTTPTSRSMQEIREIPNEPVIKEETVIKNVYVNVSTANLRSGSSTSFEIVDRASRKEALAVLAEENGWYKIKTTSGTAYILKSLVVNSLEEVVIPQEPVVKEPEKAPTTNVSSATGDKVVALAKQYLGCSYVYGGSGPKSFDCSGFTQYIYKQFGISLAHSAVSQANNGTYIAKSNLQLGDLVIFRDWDNVSIGHCGIYIGGGNFIHAANSKRGVVTDTLNSGYYYERYVSARRLF